LQLFLRDIEGYNVVVTSIYDDQTITTVNAFQIKYKNDVLIPWGYSGNVGTSYVYILTNKKVNEIYCNTIFPLTLAQQQEIANYHKFLQGLRNHGITPRLLNIGTTTTPIIIPASTTPELFPENVVGEATTGFLANVISALKLHYCGWLNLLLLFIILILTYLWYREYSHNRKIEEANKEIDLHKL
jgi:hypothetical protein